MKQLAHKIKHYWRVYLATLRISIAMRLTYRIVIVLLFANVAADMLVYLIFATAVFAFVPEVAGFSRDTLFLLVGTSMFFEAIGWFTYRAGGSASDIIVRGNMEQNMTKPMSLRYLAMFRRMDIEDSVRFVTGLILFVPHMSAIAEPLWLRFPLYIATLIGGLVAHYSLLSSIGATAFVFGKIEGLYAVIEQTTELSRYPHTIFKRPLRYVFMTLLPTALFASIPTLVLVSDTPWQWLGIEWALALVLYFVSGRFWNWCVSKYGGASG